MDSIQDQLKDFTTSTQLIEEEMEDFEKWRYWLKVEEVIVKQKSILQWPQQGDENTKFFLASVK